MQDNVILLFENDAKVNEKWGKIQIKNYGISATVSVEWWKQMFHQVIIKIAIVV